MSFEGGVDSGRVSTIASEGMPYGLRRNQLAFLTNGTVRGGGISPRFGWIKLVSGAPWSGLYQSGFTYEQLNGNPYLVLSIGGRIFNVRVDEDNRIEETTIPGDANPPLVDQGFMEQGEQFLIIQAGDFTTLPLFWDGTTLRRSVGLNVPAAQRELPPAGPMDYFMGRLWYAVGRTYTAGDIVNGPSGTPGPPYMKRDSILKVTENPLAIGGDGFIVPTQSGNIRALKYSSNLDTQLGQGSLFVFTRKAIYATDPPVTRAEWITSTEPLQRVAQNRYGSYNDRSVVSVNGDLFYQSTDGIRSLFVAIRDFQQWGNTPISRNENRVLVFNDRSLMRFSSGIEFDNRLLQTVLPTQTPVGVAFQGIVPLDFDLISSLGDKLPPAWEGMWEGLDVLQLFEGDFGGLQRAFAVVVSRLTGEIEVWELTLANLFEQDDNRIQWQVEWPSFTWDQPFMLKQLHGAELWIDRLFGTVNFYLYYRNDQNPCYQFWHAWKECAARDCLEDELNPCDPTEYPEQPYCSQYRATMSLPEPPHSCDATNGRPTNFGYQFQVKLVVRGSCRVRGMLLHAHPIESAPFRDLVC